MPKNYSFKRLNSPNYIDTFNLCCYYQNVRGLNTKVEEFYNITSTCEYQIIGLSETWLSDDVSDAELFPACYTVFRSDRNFATTGLSRGGGVLLAVDSSFKCIRINVDALCTAFPGIDILGCKVVLSNVSVSIFVLYIPPTISSNEFDLFIETFETLNCFSTDSKLLILGDFNVPLYNIDPNNSKSRTVINFTNFINVCQTNSIVNHNGRLLDLILTNVSCNVSRDDSPLTKEDPHHPALTIDINLNNFISKEFLYNGSSRKHNFRRANFLLMYEMIQVTDWSYLESFTDINDACEHFYNIINNIFNTCVPVYKQNNRTYPPWFNLEIINNIRKKDRAHKNYKKFNTNIYLEQFKTLRSLIKQQIKAAYETYIHDLERNIHSDPSKFWSFVQTKKNRSRIPGAVHYNNVTYDTPQSVVDGFASFFSDVYLQSDPSHKVPLLSLNNTHVNIKPITDQDIINAAKKLKNKLTSGVDNVPSFIVRDCIYAFIAPLRFLFNLILTTGIYPDIWKTTKLCPILKTGDSSFITNYRPIAILCNFGKLLEIIIYEHIYCEIKSHISPYQHGFMEKRSTISNLTCITQFISDTLDSQGQVDVIYTDIQKAFDKIDHFLLLSKLNAIGVSEALLSLLESYLLNRIQSVEYGGYNSRSFVATSGVPQGSNLGPLLFLVFINDLSLGLSSTHLFFADDLKIYSKVSTPDDCSSLQIALNTVNEWCDNNYLKLNVAKCKVMSFYNNRKPVLFVYNIDNAILERCTKIKDLGVTFDSRLSFSGHINTIVSSAAKVLGYCIRNWGSFTDINTLKLIYVSFVRSKLEYASVIWSPIYQNSKTQVESVQRKFLKYMFFKHNGFYPQRGIDHNILLNLFDLNSLEFRRNCTALQFLYKILHNQLDCVHLLNRINFLVPRQNARQHNAFYLNTSRTNIQVKSPMFNMCKVFNDISHLCDVNFDNLNYIIHTYKGIQVIN